VPLVPSLVLETKVFCRIIFNVSLWLDSRARSEGDSLQAVLFPKLALLTRSSPGRVRDCVGTKDMIHALREIVVDMNGNEKKTISGGGIAPERLEIVEVIFGMIFEVIAAGTTPEHLSPFLHFLSASLEAGWPDSKSGQREIAVRACIVLVFLLQIRPVVSGLFESFAECCESIQSATGWILCAMVNADDDEIRSLGIRSIAAFLEVTSYGPDTVLSLSSTLPQGRTSEALSSTDVTSNVIRASNRIGRLAKGLASIGPTARASIRLPSKLTPRVIFKLLWHFLKNQRYRLSDFTHTALLSLISDDSEVRSPSFAEHVFLKDHILVPTNIVKDGFRLSTAWAQMTLAQTGNTMTKSLRNPLAIGTIFRLLRFFEEGQKDRWLSDLVGLCHSSRKCLSLLASLPDWQPSLFQLISDTLELVRSHSSNEIPSNCQKMTGGKGDSESTGSNWGGAPANCDQRRLDTCLNLFSTLLGHLLRESGDKVRLPKLSLLFAPM
jgi:hypothetical protein